MMIKAACLPVWLSIPLLPQALASLSATDKDYAYTNL